ncbi:polysaccharide pyruvyl transferase family protein [Klebsiella sp. CVUAS 11332]|jgi:pyruvyl transferase EpsO|uniref:polysaccharide pyruvyl transferase family protein n=2 Tax=unclassified Klebsiella TaxID=2608929 RepID=UPI001F324E98|nr:polysaccharide pyruvyl transferase family protein [Klebsiella sp. CVUAS 11332]MBW6033541.1 polysaccharide pyruvyl transferase [Klebsiella sp. CVUAS 11332]
MLANKQMLELKNNLLSIVKFINDKNNVIFIDYPLYHNVGDLLIFQGTQKFFKDNNINVKMYRSAHDYNLEELKENVDPQTTLICQGGGNFGDLYDVHQNIRLSLVTNFKNNRIIILPQTAHFSDENKLNLNIDIFKQHPNVILFARDTNTFELFQRFTDKVYLMPDMAHQLYGELPVSAIKKNNPLYFLRVDKEKNDLQQSLMNNNEIQSIDWEDFVTSNEFRYERILSKVSRLANKINSGFLKNIVYHLWNNHSSQVVNRSARYFSQYDLIITSRMHGHILSCLVNRDNKVIDNSYGKNSGYFNEWTKKTLLGTLLVKDK